MMTISAVGNALGIPFYCSLVLSSYFQCLPICHVPRTLHTLVPGAAKKNTPLQKSHYFQNNSKFFGEIFRGYSGDI